MLTIIAILCGAVVSVFFYYKYLQMKNYWAKKGAPYINPLPLIGNISCNLSEDFIKNIYDAYPTKRYVGLHQFHQPTLLVRDPELIKTIMVKEFNSFSDHSMFNRGICEPYEGLFFLSATKGWHEIRTILSPAFTNSKLRLMFKLVDECGDIFVNYFQNQDPVMVDLKDAFSRYTNDAILTTAFGVSCNSFKDKHNLVYATGKTMANFSGIKGLKVFSYNISPFFTKLLNVQIVTEKTGAVFEKIITEALEVRKEKNIARPDVIQLMMETKTKDKNRPKTDFTNKDFTAAAISFYFAGFDTTSTSLTFVAYALAVYPEVQKKVQWEVDEVLKRSNGNLTFEEVMNMEYLEMVIFEALRKWCPAPFADRLCVKPFTIEPVNSDEQPVTIETGTSVWFSATGLHHDSKHFEEPDKFDPERFNQENRSKRHPYSYLTFGAGPRICLGNRYAIFVMKLILAKIVHHFELLPCEKTVIPLNLGFGISVLPKQGVWIAFKPRDGKIFS